MVAAAWGTTAEEGTQSILSLSGDLSWIGEPVPTVEKMLAIYEIPSMGMAWSAEIFSEMMADV
jgi:hypothetical protein